MKKFEPESNAYTPPLVYESPKNETFDITKLLQILPKLNLSGLFGAKQNSTDQQQPAMPNNNNVDNVADTFMRRQNYIETQKVMATHFDTIKRIREENSTMQ